MSSTNFEPIFGSQRIANIIIASIIRKQVKHWDAIKVWDSEMKIKASLCSLTFGFY